MVPTKKKHQNGREFCKCLVDKYIYIFYEIKTKQNYPICNCSEANPFRSKFDTKTGKKSQFVKAIKWRNC